MQAVTELIVTDGYFDGHRHHGRGPYTVALAGEHIVGITPGAPSGSDRPVAHRTTYLMPGLVEAHAHLFLDGGELDPARRAAYLNSGRDRMLEVGRRSLRRSLDHGITLVRDAGDIHGINVELRREASQGCVPGPRVRCPGVAIRKAGRYGSFMAREVGEQDSIESVMRSLVAQADEFKVLLTGIIDFDAGGVKGSPQFSAAEARRIGSTARALGRRTFVHCSGAEGIDIALEAGFDSVEHGFFVTREQLERMAERQVAWVPTFSPVHFQSARPDVIGWSAGAVGNLQRILDTHRQRLAQAFALGVPVMAGSDAGSHGVAHGSGLIDEIDRMADAAIGAEKLLAAATSVPRAAWGLESADIVAGGRAELVLLDASPLDDLRALRAVRAVHCRGTLRAVARPRLESSCSQPDIRKELPGE